MGWAITKLLGASLPWTSASTTQKWKYVLNTSITVLPMQCGTWHLKTKEYCNVQKGMKRHWYEFVCSFQMHPFNVQTTIRCQRARSVLSYGGSHAAAEGCRTARWLWPHWTTKWSLRQQLKTRFCKDMNYKHLQSSLRRIPLPLYMSFIEVLFIVCAAAQFMKIIQCFFLIDSQSYKCSHPKEIIVKGK